MDLQKQIDRQLMEPESARELKKAEKQVLALRQEIDEINRSLTGKLSELKRKFNSEP